MTTAVGVSDIAHSCTELEYTDVVCTDAAIYTVLHLYTEKEVGFHSVITSQ